MKGRRGKQDIHQIHQGSRLVTHQDLYPASHNCANLHGDRNGIRTRREVD